MVATPAAVADAVDGKKRQFEVLSLQPLSYDDEGPQQCGPFLILEATSQNDY